ncbi:uncharacterized protein I303_101851 [Kwoniella dejecticola CBS 10117]|uniref:F-box domain-containing protein n=1 Tax=Kwoniella dejecticola CBS 10117 TaxID=1296121 RepID=A0A1A6ACL9_9TREE|nr:uncharacterized protein I303_02013 [Kwoniella dejecticola CBS 10117]OBR87800.1 hypothetical protein I303_02013 [Kwoniella dejecticola CBS 10117]
MSSHANDGDYRQSGLDPIECEEGGKQKTQTTPKNVYKQSIFSFHLDKIHDQPSEELERKGKEKQEDKDKERDHKMGKSKSFANLAEVFGFSYNYGRPSSKSGILPRPKSSASLERRSSYTKRHCVPDHLPTHIIIRILSYCSDDTLSSCLRVSKLLFGLSGHILYDHLVFESPKNMVEKLKGSTILYENTTRKVAVGRKRFKDRLLRHTEQVTLHSHGDDNDNDDEDQTQEEEDYFGNFSRLSIFSNNNGHSRSSSTSSIFSFGKSKSNPTTPVEIPLGCPHVSLSEMMPRLKTLRIILADAFDYHLLFCPRFNSPCPLLEGLEIEKLVVVGARSPLVVLPNSFPSTTSLTTTPTLTTAPFADPNLLTPPITSPGVTKKIRSTGGLPIGLKELTIVVPTGRSYDLKDYEGYENIFTNKRTLDTIMRITLVFLTVNTPTPESKFSRSKSEAQGLWQIAYYNSRQSPYATSFSSLIEDLVRVITSLPLTAEIEIVGIENFDGELLNMGIGIMKQGKNKIRSIIEDRIRNQLYVRLIAKNRQSQVNAVNEKVVFTDLHDWLQDKGNAELGDHGFEELAKEGWREYRR